MGALVYIYFFDNGVVLGTEAHYESESYSSKISNVWTPHTTRQDGLIGTNDFGYIDIQNTWWPDRSKMGNYH